MRSRTPSFTIVPTLCCVLLATACTGAGGTNNDGATRTDGGALVIAFPNNEQADAKSLDPNIGGGTTYVNSIYGAMFDQLVYQDPTTGKMVPGIAKRWETSADGRRYTFHLTKKAKFWDGTPVTAEDVKFSIDRAKNPRYLPGNAYVSALLANYSRSVVDGPAKITIYLTKPQTNFLPSVLGRTYLSIVSKRSVESVGVKKFGEQPMGSGPFEFVEWVKGDHITVKRHDDYAWGPRFFKTSGRAPSVEKLEFRFIQDDATRMAALDSGQVNAIQGIPPFDQDRLSRAGRYELIETRKNGQPGGVNLNTQRAPTDDQLVRKAIAYAVDRQAINESVYAGSHYAARYILEERMGQWVNKDAPFPSQDKARARELLDRAGWTAGSDGIRVSDGERLVLKAICPPELQQVMTLIQAQLRKVGIKLDVQSMSAAQVSSTAQAGGEFHMAWVIRPGWTNEDPYLLYSLFDSKNAPPKGTSNYSQVKVPEVDRFLEEAAVTQDVDERRALYYKAQELLVDHAPFIPLISFNQNIVALDGVHGLVPDMRGTYTYFQDVWIDPGLHDRWG